MRRNDSTLLPSYIGGKAYQIRGLSAIADKTCDILVEPFCGSAAFTMATPICRYQKFIINDMNSNITYLYEAMRRESTRDRMVEELMKVRKSDDEIVARYLFDNAKKQLLPTGQVDISQVEDNELIRVGVNTYIAYTQSFNSNSKNYRRQISELQYKRESAARIKNAHEKFKGLQSKLHITCTDGIKLIKKFKNCQNVQMYLDPPYVGLYRLCNNLYRHEMPLLIEHIKLALELNDAKCAVILSGYRSQDSNIPTIYDALLTGEEWKCFKLCDTYKKCKNSKHGESKERCSEYIWTNRVPTYAELDLSMKNYKEDLSFDDYWRKIAERCKLGKLPKKDIKEYRLTYQQLYGKELY